MNPKFKIYRLLRDIRVEVFLAAMIQNKSLELDQFLVRPVGLFKRRHSKDILKIQVNNPESDSTYYEIDVSREGLYDMLPEGLFHKVSGEKRKKNNPDKIEVYDPQKSEEIAARKFFLPLEQEFYRERIYLELGEQNAANLTDDRNEDRSGISLSDFWGINKVFTKQQNSILLYLLPIAHKIVGDFRLTALAISLVLGKKVDIEYKISLKSFNTDLEVPTLCNITLGKDTVLGEGFVDGLPTISVNVTFNDGNEIIDFLNEQSGEKRLQYLYDYLLPIGFPVKTEYLKIENERPFVLSEDSDNYLGYATTI